MAGIDRIAIHNLFGINGLNVAWYGIIIATAIVVGVMVAAWQAKKSGYTSELIFDMMILALPLSIVGARIYYVAFEWENYVNNPLDIIKTWHGGLAIYGAVIGAVIGALILSKWRKFPFGRLLDIAVPGLVLGQAIGRWGNFINMEAFGREITDPKWQFFPFGVFVDQQWVGGVLMENRWFLATFFYEFVWNLGVFALLLWYSKRAKHDGNVFAMYMIGYGLGRLWIEQVRIQTLMLWPGMPVSQFISLIIIIVGVAYILIQRKRNVPNVLYEGRYCIGWEDPGKEDKSNKDKKDKKKKTNTNQPPQKEQAQSPDADNTGAEQ